MISPKVVNLLKAMIRNERLRRDRIVDILVRRELDRQKIPALHSARNVVADHVFGDELEARALRWLALCRRVFRETRTPWTEQHTEQMTTNLGEAISEDAAGLKAKFFAVPGIIKEVGQPGYSASASDYALTRIRDELLLLALAQEAARVPLQDQLLAARYAAVRAAWSRANDQFAAHPKDYRPVVLEATGAVEELARLLIGNPTATLGSAIRELRKDDRVPPPLLSGIEELWGWASGEPGVRHGASVDSPVSSDEARYVLTLANGAIGLLISRDVA